MAARSDVEAWVGRFPARIFAGVVRVFLAGVAFFSVAIDGASSLAQTRPGTVPACDQVRALALPGDRMKFSDLVRRSVDGACAFEVAMHHRDGGRPSVARSWIDYAAVLVDELARPRMAQRVLEEAIRWGDPFYRDRNLIRLRSVAPELTDRFAKSASEGGADAIAPGHLVTSCHHGARSADPVEAASTLCRTIEILASLVRQPEVSVKQAQNGLQDLRWLRRQGSRIDAAGLAELTRIETVLNAWQTYWGKVSLAEAVQAAPDKSRHYADAADIARTSLGGSDPASADAHAGRWNRWSTSEHGTYDLPHGMRFEGYARTGMPHGPGRITLADGSVAAGVFEEGLLLGRGRFERPDGTLYTGWWRSGTLHGRTTVAYPDGRLQEGEFRRGFAVGPHVIASAAGERRVVHFGAPGSGAPIRVPHPDAPIKSAPPGPPPANIASLPKASLPSGAALPPPSSVSPPSGAPPPDSLWPPVPRSPAASLPPSDGNGGGNEEMPPGNRQSSTGILRPKPDGRLAGDSQVATALRLLRRLGYDRGDLMESESSMRRAIGSFFLDYGYRGKPEVTLELVRLLRQADPLWPVQSMNVVGTGTGFRVNANGYLVTNRHVIDGCDRLTVHPLDGDPQPASVVAFTDAPDLAVLWSRVATPGFGRFRSEPEIRQGEDVVVYGFPYYLKLAKSGSLTSGQINATAGLDDDTNHFQISAPIQPGNSGGPMLDDRGRVIGVVVSKLVRSFGGRNDIPQNVNFAVKDVAAMDLLRRIDVPFEYGKTGPRLSNADIGDIAKAMVVLIACWAK